MVNQAALATLAGRLDLLCAQIPAASGRQDVVYEPQVSQPRPHERCCMRAAHAAAAAAESAVCAGRVRHGGRRRRRAAPRRQRCRRGRRGGGRLGRWGAAVGQRVRACRPGTCAAASTGLSGPEREPAPWGPGASPLRREAGMRGDPGATLPSCSQTKSVPAINACWLANGWSSPSGGALAKYYSRVQDQSSASPAPPPRAGPPIRPASPPTLSPSAPPTQVSPPASAAHGCARPTARRPSTSCPTSAAVAPAVPARPEPPLSAAYRPSPLPRSRRWSRSRRTLRACALSGSRRPASVPRPLRRCSGQLRQPLAGWGCPHQTLCWRPLGCICPWGCGASDTWLASPCGS